MTTLATATAVLDRSVSIVIPTYNEARRLPRTLRDVYAWLAAHATDFEVIISDDGSTDGTRELAEKLARELRNVRVVGSTHNHGKGAAVRAGLREATGELRCYMDADHSTPISELAAAAKLAKRGADVMVGSRYVRGSQISRRQPLARVAVSRLSNLAIRAFVVPGIHDTQNGFKVLTARASDAILPYLSVNGWAFDVELLLVARRLGLRVVEFPVAWRNDADSRLRIGRALWQGGRELAGVTLRRFTGRYPLRRTPHLPSAPRLS